MIFSHFYFACPGFNPRGGLSACVLSYMFLCPFRALLSLFSVSAAVSFFISANLQCFLGFLLFSFLRN